MKQAVRHVMHWKFNGNLSSRSAYAQQPLEPCVEVHEVEPEQPAFLPSSTVQSFSISHDEAYALVDTGCQRTAVGRNTLTKIMRCMPSDLQVKFETKDSVSPRSWMRNSHNQSCAGSSLLWQYTRRHPCSNPRGHGRSTSVAFTANLAGLGDLH